MSKIARVIFSVTDAWEEWSLEVPDDADEAWVMENYGDNSVYWQGLEDAGNSSMTPVEVIKIDDR